MLLFHLHARTFTLYWVIPIIFFLSCVVGIDLHMTKPERDSGSYGSVGSPVGDPECRSNYDGLQAQCDQAMHQLQLLRHKHSDTIRRFVLVLFHLAKIYDPFFIFYVVFSHITDV